MTSFWHFAGGVFAASIVVGYLDATAFDLFVGGLLMVAADLVARVVEVWTGWSI